METKNYYLKEFQYFDGENDITFNIVDINTEKMVINIAVSKTGKISVIEYDLKQDKNGEFYFEYGICNQKIEINDFEWVTQKN